MGIHRPGYFVLVTECAHDVGLVFSRRESILRNEILGCRTPELTRGGLLGFSK